MTSSCIPCPHHLEQHEYGVGQSRHEKFDQSRYASKTEPGNSRLTDMPLAFRLKWNHDVFCGSGRILLESFNGSSLT